MLLIHHFPNIYYKQEISTKTVQELTYLEI